MLRVMATRFTIVGLGEALFDVFPDREELGGAPLNVAVHAQQLGKPVGVSGVVVSRVGQDDRGQQIVEALRQRDMDLSHIQTDPDRPTGTVYVDLRADGTHDFDIVRDVAWDWLQFDPDLDELARRCSAVSFGSLAQRNGQARSSILRFLSAARSAIRLFDVNLRQDYYDSNILRKSCDHATVVKLNEQELPTVARLVGLSGGDDEQPSVMAGRLRQQYKLKAVVLTRGERGTQYITADGVADGQPPTWERADDADSVGAGDACTAGVLVGMLLRWPVERIVHLANHMGAFVASQGGATPELPDDLVRMARPSPTD